MLEAFRRHCLQNPRKVVGDARVDSGRPRPRAASSATHDADEIFDFPPLNPKRSAGVALTSVFAASGFTRAKLAFADPTVRLFTLLNGHDVDVDVTENLRRVRSAFSSQAPTGDGRRLAAFHLLERVPERDGLNERRELFNGSAEFQEGDVVVDGRSAAVIRMDVDAANPLYHFAFLLRLENVVIAEDDLEFLVVGAVDAVSGR